MSESKIKLRRILLVGGLAAVAYYLCGPIGLAVIALYFLLKGGLF